MTASTNVVKVGMSEENGLDFIHVIFEIFNIWYHVIDTWIIFTGEQDAHINENNLAFILDCGHVFTDTEFT